MNIVLGKQQRGDHGRSEEDRQAGRKEREERVMRDAGFDEDDEDGVSYGGYDGGQGDDIDQMQLPTKRRRQYMTFFTALTMVIAAASCILVLLLMRGQSETAAANDARSQALEDKLTTIEASLGALDQSVVATGDTTAANASAQYEELGATVDSLRTNLTDYRDNNDIQNEEIGDHLDRVIAQLDKIKEDMNAQQALEDEQGDEIGSRLDSLTRSSEAGNSNLTEELETVHKDIASLIDKAGDDQTGNYKELKGILTATDSSLSSLVADKFDETGSLISSGMSRLQGSIASVSSDVSSGLSSVNTSVTNGLQSVGEDITGVNTSLAGVGESLSLIATNIGSIDTRVGTVQTAINDLLGDLDDLADQNADENDRVLERMESVRTDVKDFRDSMKAQVQQVADQLTALQETIDQAAKEGEGGTQDEVLTALTEQVGLLQEALADAQESVDTVDGKVDKILIAMGIVEPEPDPTPVPTPNPGLGSSETSSGEIAEGNQGTAGQ